MGTLGDGWFILGTAMAVALVLARTLARRFPVPEAVLLVLAGLLVSLIPGIGSVQVPPELVLNLFLPPLVYRAAFLTAPRETREDVVPIAILAISLTAATALAVAFAVGAAVPDLSWAAALALGAAVAPTDPVAATSVIKRLGAPPRLMTILEGESLVNDGVALTAFGLALTMLSHPVTAADTMLELVRVILGGLAYGGVVAWLGRRVRRWVRDSGGQIVLSLATPFIAYLPAEHFGFSGVLATIVAGFVLGLHRDGLLQPAARLTGDSFWGVLVFLLESTLFLLLGAQLLDVFDTIESGSWLVALLVVVVVVAVRMFWTTVLMPLLRMGRFARIGLGERVAMGWAGIRGAITLAIALSIPEEASGRDLLVFLAACVVLATLVGQGTTLAPLLRGLGLSSGEAETREEAYAREALLEAALARVDELAADDKMDQRTAEVHRQLFELRLNRVREVLDDDSAAEHGRGSLRRELLAVQYRRLDQLYRKGRIGSETQRKLARELDLEAGRHAPPRPHG